MRHLPHGSHHHNSKAVASFFILLIAVSLLLVFYVYQDTILEQGNFNIFMTLTVVGAGLLVGLLYLISNSKDHVKKAPVKAKGGKAKKKK